jgi:hypothetical protein
MHETLMGYFLLSNLFLPPDAIRRWPRTTLATHASITPNFPSNYNRKIVSKIDVGPPLFTAGDADGWCLNWPV